MSERVHDRSQDFRNILDALVQVTLGLSDAELTSELEQAQGGPGSSVEGLKRRLLATAKDFQQRKLKEAREGYERREREIAKSREGLLGTPADWIARLEALFTRNPEAKALFTFEHRDFKELSKDDLAGLILHLEELGLLEKDNPSQ